jgi:hypothetical protein
MIRRLWNRIFRPRSDVKRGIFVYHDGRSYRHADPILIDAAITKHCGKQWLEWLSELKAVTEGPTPQSEKFQAITDETRQTALDNLIRMARAAFDMPAVTDTGGVGGIGALDVFGDYLNFTDQLRGIYLPLLSAAARPPIEAAESPASSVGTA